MDHKLQPGMVVIRMHERDTVVTALRDLAPGERVAIANQTVQVAEAIPFGHKIAVLPLAEGDPIYKYGEVIGRAIRAIQPGQHVHVHNLEGTRGRGDLAPKEGQ